MTQPALPEEVAAFSPTMDRRCLDIEPLPRDASVRRYFRVRLADGRSRLLAYYPREVPDQLERIRAAPVLSPDETGRRIGGNKAWLHTAATV